MQTPDIPHNEPQRLQALHDLKLLDTPPEERFDRLTRLARQMFDVSTALVSLVDEDRQWFKSRQGVDACETGRDISFCGHAILGEDIFVVSDARQDPRFADNPLVTEAPHIRFYAGVPLKTADGYAIGTLCIIDEQPRTLSNDESSALHDLAALVMAEIQQANLQLLNLEKRRLAAIIEATHIGTWEWNVDTGETVFNERWAEMIGYTLEELTPISINTWMKFAHPDDLAGSAQALRAHFSGELDYYDVQCRMRHKQGHWVWVYDRGQVVSWTADGMPEWMYGTHADITAQKQAELALQQNEARLRGLFELSPIGIALNDYESGAFIDLNDALLRPTGYTREEFVALSYWDITPKEYEAKELDQLKSLEQIGRFGPFEKEYIRKDGSHYPVLLNGMVVHDSTGRKLIWSMVEDISERKRIERMKNEFISTVSHELRTPLTSIAGSLGLIAGGALGELPEQVRQMVAIAHKNSQRLGYLINDLLDMEKLVAGKMRFDLRGQPLQPLLEQAIQDNRAYADQFGVRLRLSHGAGVARVRVDSQRLQQVLANLLSNAAKFSPEGGEVVVSVASDKGLVRVSVRDRGPGIPTEFHEHIFQKFSQADASDTRQKGGSGLGLAITRELVERMGGSVGFDSLPGEGATFYIELALTTEDKQG